MRVYNLAKIRHILLLLSVFTLWRCAQVAPLTGGLRDNQPPKLLNALPANASINFNSKQIELTFDEFVQLKDVANQLVITPQLSEQPVFEARGKKLVINLAESKLLPGTTYRIFFGNAVADMHEGNVLANLEYVFSTGSSIDSLKMQGSVINAFDSQKQADVTVALYPESETDSVVWKSKPLYFTKTNNNGTFNLNYLPAGNFKSFAFTDKNKNLKYDGGDEKVGFIAKQVNPIEDTIMEFKIFSELPSKTFIKKALSPYYGKAIVVYNTEQVNIPKLFQEKETNKLCFDKTFNDTCEIYYNSVFDTLKFVINHEASGKPDTVSINITSREKFEKLNAEGKLPFELEITNKEQGSVPFHEKVRIHFSNAIDFNKVNKELIHFIIKQDTIVAPVDFNYSPSGCDAIVINEKLKSDAIYDLIIKKGAFESATGSVNDSIKLSFKTTSPEDYASLQLKILFPDKQNYIVQLFNSKGELAREMYHEQSISSSAESVFVFKNLLPGTYSTKIIRDENKNKKWDTGNLIQKKHAEIVYLNTVPIKLLANWDSESEWKVK